MNYAETESSRKKKNSDDADDAAHGEFYQYSGSIILFNRRVGSELKDQHADRWIYTTQAYKPLCRYLKAH